MNLDPLKRAWARHVKAHPELKSLDPTLPEAAKRRALASPPPRGRVPATQRAVPRQERPQEAATAPAVPAAKAPSPPASASTIAAALSNVNRPPTLKVPGLHSELGALPSRYAGKGRQPPHPVVRKPTS